MRPRRAVGMFENITSRSTLAGAIAGRRARSARSRPGTRRARPARGAAVASTARSGPRRWTRIPTASNRGPMFDGAGSPLDVSLLFVSARHPRKSGDISLMMPWADTPFHLAPLLSAEARLLAKADAGRGRIAEQFG